MALRPRLRKIARPTKHFGLTHPPSVGVGGAHVILESMPVIYQCLLGPRFVTYISPNTFPNVKHLQDASQRFAIEQRLGQLGCVVGLLLGANYIFLTGHALEQEGELTALTTNGSFLCAGKLANVTHCRSLVVEPRILVRSGKWGFHHVI